MRQLDFAHRACLAEGERRRRGRPAHAGRARADRGARHFVRETGAGRMNILRLPLAALAWLGRQGTRAVAAIVFVAIAAPPVDSVLKPFVSEAIFILLAIAFMRVDTTALRRY